MFKNLFSKKSEVYQNFMAGQALPLTAVPDKVFSSGMMGQGYAIEPKDGKVYAPFSGKIATLFPTGHAIGIETNDGYEILIHLGIDTVELGGRGFESHVMAGSKVKQGDLLITMDVNEVKDQGKPTICPIIFTSGEEVNLLKSDVFVEALEEDVLMIKKA